MPAVTSGTALVTGANGFIGIWVVKYHLESGFTVKAVVRSEAKGEHLVNLFKDYGNKLQIVTIDDFTLPGAFDEAVKDVDVIQHIASPCYFTAQSVEEIVGTAKRATKVVLDSALKNGGARLKRVIICSSIAAVTRLILSPPEEDPLPLPSILNESNWNEYALNEIRTKGDATDGTTLYCASKTVAEQLVWEFMETHKPSWDLATINPAFVFGPVIHEVSKLEALNETMDLFLKQVIQPTAPAELRATSGNAWVDIRNIAEAHLAASTVEKAGGERFILAAEAFTFQEFIDAMIKVDPSLPLPRDKATESRYWQKVETTKARDVLGIRYYTKEECAKATLENFRAKGWLPALTN